jgi:2-isopropylmalate synthase
MQKPPITKYKPFPQVSLPNRQWPSRTITQAPTWCSVDLRDGNQALITPMSIQSSLEMFDLLVATGFKEIEVGFPSANDIYFNFLRQLIEENRIPDDVTIQVLVQAREHLIRRTFESLQGAKQAIVHLYNSTNPLQRRVTFGKSKEEMKAIAVDGTKLVKELVPSVPDTHIRFQYSPESFSDTELEYSLEVCEAVMDIWQPTAEEPIILNLPATVEIATPNVHADQIEWFCTHMKDRDKAIISLHTHNDRGTGVAATELGLLAGADRVEGTLFGNGERTGNLDVVTAALNLYSQGIDPQLNFSNLNQIREVYERCTRMTVHERHPYAGELVFTAFSGSHQDAIKKGMDQMDTSKGALWQVPYLAIDPNDIGRNYKAIIRINNQSGKGGVAYIMEHEFGFEMPKKMHPEFSRVVNEIADKTGIEITSAEIHSIFKAEYIDSKNPFELENFRTKSLPSGEIECWATVQIQNTSTELNGTGNGPIDAFVNALQKEHPCEFELLSYSEHSLGTGANSQAVSYIQISNKENSTWYGAGIHTNIEIASIKALLSALNRSQK